MGRERGYCQGRITRGGDNRWPPRRRHNKWVFLSFFHLVTLCFIPPNKRVDPRATPSLPARLPDGRVQ